VQATQHNKATSNSSILKFFMVFCSYYITLHQEVKYYQRTEIMSAQKDGVAWLANYRATIEKERFAQDRWWSEWGFLAETGGVMPNNKSEFIAALEEKYKKLSAGKPFPGFSQESTKWGDGETLDNPSECRMRKMKHITPTDPY
jgi:hypothetical protein